MRRAAAVGQGGRVEVKAEARMVMHATVAFCTRPAAGCHTLVSEHTRPHSTGASFCIAVTQARRWARASSSSAAAAQPRAGAASAASPSPSANASSLPLQLTHLRRGLLCVSGARSEAVAQRRSHAPLAAQTPCVRQRGGGRQRHPPALGTQHRARRGEPLSAPPRAGRAGMRAWWCVACNAATTVAPRGVRFAKRFRGTTASGDGFWGQWRRRRGALAMATAFGDGGDGFSMHYSRCQALP
jgi:hypothetical protein